MKLIITNSLAAKFISAVCAFRCLVASLPGANGELPGFSPSAYGTHYISG